MKAHIEGLSEFERALKTELPKATRRSVLRRAGMNVMQPVADRMEELAPRDEGELAGSMKVQPAKAKLARALGTPPKQGVVILAGPAPQTQRGRLVAIIQEFGSVKQAPQPYARPAADAMAGNVIRDIKSALAAEFKRAKDRIARKAARLAARGG